MIKNNFSFIEINFVEKASLMGRISLLLAFVFCTLTLLAQDQNLAIGQWRSHLPYNEGIYVTQSPEQVFYATNQSFLSLNKIDREVRFFSKVDGLSNVGVKLIKYHPPTETLIIVYENSVIDLFSNNEIITLNQIRNFSNIQGQKTINDVFVDTDSTVLLSASYGLSKLNVVKGEFVFTTFTGIDVLGSAVYNNNIYITTPEGIYRTNLNNSIPEDFSRWAFLSEADGFPMDYSAKSIVPFNESLYLSINNQISKLNSENQLTLVFNDPNLEIEYLTAEGIDLLAGFRCRTSSECGSGRVVVFDTQEQIRIISGNCIANMRYAIQDETGKIYFADRNRNFRILENPDDNSCQELSFNSPWNLNNYEIAIANNEVWVTAGGVNQTFSNIFSPSGFYSFIEGQWTNYNRNFFEVFKGINPSDGGDDLLDFISIVVHPSNNSIYAGSFYEGLVVYDRENFTLYNEQNSSLRNAVGDQQRTRVSGLAFDENNNLWLTNHSATNPISVFTNEGEWQSFRPSCNKTALHQLVVDENGYKWAVDGSTQDGIIVFDEGAMDNSNDDRCKTFNQNNSNLPTNNTNCIVVDLSGDVWVGTTEGILIFECGSDPFADNCIGSLRGFEEGGFVELLLNTENIRTIAVDGANRKWIGTRNGVFVLSEDGDEQIMRFTSENSPLLDNVLIDIAINQENGEVFFGTNSGVISYRSDAIVGGRIHSSNIKVFPNPVRPDYFGPIAIQGLAANANVKITDLTGKLVFETEALGGQAIWEGTDYNGRRVNTGVYLVFSSTVSDGFSVSSKPDAAVAKIVVVN